MEMPQTLWAAWSCVQSPLKNKFLLHSDRISVFQVVPIASHVVTGHHREKPGSNFFTSPYQGLTHMARSPRASLLKAEHSQLPQPLLMSDALASSSQPFAGLTPVSLYLVRGNVALD